MTRLNRILFPTDFSARADAAMGHAAALAEAYDADLHVLHVEDSPESLTPSASSEAAAPEARRRLGELIARMATESRGFEVVPVVRIGEAAAPTIVDYAREAGIDMIVIATHGRRGVRRMFLGSVTEEIVRTAPCPVYTIRQHEKQPPPRAPRRVVVPVDFSGFGSQALQTARRMVADDGEILLVHAVEQFVPPGVYGLEYPSYHELTAEVERHAREEMEKMARAETGPEQRSSVHIQTGYAPSAIVDFADEKDADLIVMSTHGRSGVERMLLGSVTEKVVRTSHRPVLIIRSFAEGEADQS